MARNKNPAFLFTTQNTYMCILHKYLHICMHIGILRAFIA